MDIVPLTTGYIRVPGHRVERYQGLVVAGPVIVFAYLVRVSALSLFDTGIAVNQDADQRLPPSRGPHQRLVGCCGYIRIRHRHHRQLPSAHGSRWRQSPVPGPADTCAGS